MTTLYESFGSLVRESRSKAGLTQGDLGKRVGLSRTAITNIEKGNQGVTLLQLYEIAAQLRIHPRDLLPDASFDAQPSSMAYFQELVTQQSDQELLKKMIGALDASRS